MEKILISRCLLGERVRYDGESAPCNHPLIQQWHNEGRLVAICPEIAGGLPCPRPAAEIEGGEGALVLENRARVVTREARDLTDAFIHGAKIALALCREQEIKLAILKARSPSCGSLGTYDGCFSGALTDGQGVTAALLTREGIAVLDETRLEEAALVLKQLGTLVTAGPAP